MFSLTKRQLALLHEACTIVACSDDPYHFGNPDPKVDGRLYYSKVVMLNYTDCKRFVERYVEFGGDAWLDLAAQRHLICLRSLSRLSRELS